MEAWRRYLIKISTGKTVKKRTEVCDCPPIQSVESLIIDSNNDFVINSNGDFLLVVE